MKDFMKRNWVLLTLIIFIVMSSIWLLFKGLPYQHDIGFHFSRMVSLAQTMRHGDILALVHDAFYGYGYALGIFYGNFFFYLPSFLYLIGLPSIFSFKILYLFMNIGTVLITYYTCKRIIPNKKIAVLTTMLYTFSEYRLYDYFVRGAVGETLAFMVAPLVILGLYEIIVGDYKKWYLFSIGFVLLLLSHMITTILMAFFCVLIITIQYKRFLEEKKRFFYLILSGIVGLLLGAFFLFPILEQYFFSNISIFVDGSFYAPSGYAIRRMIIPRWFFTPYLGVPLIMLFPIRFFFSKKEIDQKYQSLLFFNDVLLVLGILSFVCTTRIFPWAKLTAIVSFVQFSWRLLLFTTLFFCISVGINLFFLLQSKRKDIVKTISWFIILTAFFTNLLYFVQYGIRVNHYDNFYENEIGNAEYLLSGTDWQDIDKPLEEILTNHSDLIVSYTKKGTSITVEYSNNLQEDTYVELPLFNYLGYQVDHDLKIEDGTNHLIRVYLKDSSGKFQVSYQGTMVQKISYIVSFVSLIGFSGFIIKKNIRKK